MKVSLIVTCGFIQHTDPEKARLEAERFRALQACLINCATLDYSKGDEVVVVEYVEKSRLEKTIYASMQGWNKTRGRYVFAQGKGFNQSVAKNAGAVAAQNEILCWINSDVIVRHNIFDVLRKRFEANNRTFATLARHDVFFDHPNLLEFIQAINRPESYFDFNTEIQDASWHLTQKRPKTPIPTTIQAFQDPRWKIIPDFQAGYINFGELMAYTKETWKKYPYDEQITAIVDCFARDLIFGNEENFNLEFLHNETAIFHMSGSDYMGQEKAGSNKYTRLIADIKLAAEKYPCMRHWLVFGYFKEFDDLIAKLNIPFKEMVDTWRTPYMWQYFRDKDHVKKLYHVDDINVQELVAQMKENLRKALEARSNH